MGFQELDELLDPTLRLPIKGRTYVVPAPPAKVGLRVTRLVAAAGQAAQGQEFDAELVADEEEEVLYADVLGSAYAEMVDAGVSWPELKHASVTAMLWVAKDKATAEKFWNSGGDPNLMAPNRETRRSGGANTTRSQGSTSGTSTRTGGSRNRGRRRR